ncbi:6-phosphofructokinase [Chloroflexota bacterium]
MKTKRRIGVLTGGGDCPGLNAAIRAVTKSAIQLDYDVIGFLDGLKGLMNGEYQILDKSSTSGIIDKGGTILGSTGFAPSEVESRSADIFRTFKDLTLEALVVIGGNTTLQITGRLADNGLPIIGIPKTIDNDVKETDFTIGFQTAVQIATDALDRLRSTAESHHRVMILEVMGRDTGWIATYSGMASGADAILVPEIPVDMEKLFGMLRRRNENGKRFSVIVVAEGTKLNGGIIADYGNSGGVGTVLGRIVREKTGLEARTTLLGYVQRGGTPVAYDRSLATALGVKATELIVEKKYGEMTALKGNRITSVPLEKVADGIKTLDLNVYKIAEKFFG